MRTSGLKCPFHGHENRILKGLSAALCLENSIIVISLEFPDKPTLLTAKMISQVCGANFPTPPRFATPAELARIRAGLD